MTSDSGHGYEGGANTMFVLSDFVTLVN